MNIKTALLQKHSKSQTLLIANHIADDKSKFATLMKYVLGDDIILAQRAAWVMSYCCEMNELLLMPFMNDVTDKLYQNTHDAVKRNIVRVLQTIPLPEMYHGKIVDACFKLIASADEPVAVKCFAMTTALRICILYPELISEFKIIIESQLPYATAGLKSRVKKTQALLSRY